MGKRARSLRAGIQGLMLVLRFGLGFCNLNAGCITVVLGDGVTLKACLFQIMMCRCGDT